MSMMFVLKYGSCDVMYLGLTLVVPLAHLAFSLHSTDDVSVFDVCGLLVLVSGLIMYRFGYRNPASTTATYPERVPPSDDVVQATYRRLNAGENDRESVVDVNSEARIEETRPITHSSQKTSEDGVDKAGFL